MRRSSLLPGSVLLMMASLFAGGMCLIGRSGFHRVTPVQGASAAEGGLPGHVPGKERCRSSTPPGAGSETATTTPPLEVAPGTGSGRNSFPRAEAAGTEARLRDVIQDMLDGIGDSHFAPIPREAADALDPSAIAAGTSTSASPAT